MLRYLRLLSTQLRISFAMAAVYRWDFLVSGTLAILWTLMGLVPLYVAFRATSSIGGWTYESALVVVGWFTLLKGLLDGAVNPSLTAVVDQIRTGTLDFVLIKPADAQFLVSTARFEPWKIIDVVAALGIEAWAFIALGRWPAPSGVLLAFGLLAVAVVVLYSVWILVIAAAFWVVRLDNLAYLFNSLFDFARWPVTIFRGIYRLVFTFVIPLAVMTTYPAQALLGTLTRATTASSLLGSLVFIVAARLVWTRAISHYTSASS